MRQIRIGIAVVFCLMIGLSGTVHAADPLDRQADKIRTVLASDKPVMVLMYASWCPVCHRTAAAMRQLHAVHGSKVKFVGLSIDKDMADFKTFQKRLPFPSYRIEAAALQRVFPSVNLRGVPTELFIDSRGRLVASGTYKPETIHRRLTDLAGR